jgi:hypothetical protein
VPPPPRLPPPQLLPSRTRSRRGWLFSRSRSKSSAAATSAEEAAERAKTAAAVTETAARDAAQATAREKVGLEARVLELERDLGMATTDLATAGRQFSQVTNQLQVVSEEATQLRESNAKLSQDLEGESRICCLSLFRSLLASCHILTCLVVVVGACVYHVGVTTKLAEVKQEPNTALLKVIEKDGVIRRLSGQLQNKCRT